MRRGWWGWIAAALIGGCAGVPVQEMSDARQTIQAAEAAGAVERAPGLHAEARRLLREAERALEAGHYRRARRLAVRAREVAAEARAAARASARTDEP